MGPDSLGIKYSETVETALGPSRQAALGVAVAGLATLAIVAATPLGFALQSLLAASVILGSFEAAWRIAAHRGPRGVRAVRLDRSRDIEVLDATRRRHAGLVCDGSFVAPWLTIIRWRPEGARFDRTILILPDMIEREGFRKLRVLLRWA